MNIVWISYYPLEPGEHAAPWIVSLARGIVEEGHTLTILTVSSKITEVKKIRSPNGYQVIVIPYKGGILHLAGLFNTRINSLERFISSYDQEIDVIHVHGTEHQFASSLLRSHKRIPFIISVQGIITLYKREMKTKLSPIYLFWSISGFYERKEIRGSENFFCRTHWDQGFVKNLNKHAKINIGWEVIRPEFFDYEHGFEGRDILFMGGKSFLKALDICLQTFDRVANRLKIVVHIVGSCDWEQIEEIKEKYSLDNINRKNIILHDRLEAREICAVYKKCFCLYHPSLIDNSPNSVCEAQVAGLPVIATNVGGVSSLIDHGETGLLVNKNDIGQHEATVLELFEKADFQKYLSSNALVLARKRHDKTVIVDQTIKAYKTLANLYV
jgi:glycosyltransferase involved in cell wall biosynthesis